jgi:hypothetical protein
MSFGLRTRQLFKKIQEPAKKDIMEKVEEAREKATGTRIDYDDNESADRMRGRIWLSDGPWRQKPGKSFAPGIRAAAG